MGRDGTRIIDDLGRELRAGAGDSRIVSLVPGLTEWLFAVGAGGRVAGVTDFCNRPGETARLPRVGGVLDPSTREILALRPGLVFASAHENRRETVEALEAAGVAVYVTAPRTVEGAISSLERLAAVAGSGEAGSRLAGELRGALGAMPCSGAPVPVFFPVWEEPLIAPGRDTFVADLLRRSGAVSVAEELGDGWPACDLAFVARSGARAVILPTEPHPYAEEDRLRWLGMPGVPAAGAGMVFLVDGELTNRPGPRMIEGVRAVRGILERVRGAAGGAGLPEGTDVGSEFER